MDIFKGILEWPPKNLRNYRYKFNLIFIIGLPLVAIVGESIADIFKVKNLFGIMMFFYIALFLWMNSWFKCPSCGKHIAYNPISFLGFTLWTYTPYTPSRCSECGYVWGENSQKNSDSVGEDD